MSTLCLFDILSVRHFVCSTFCLFDIMSVRHYVCSTICLSTICPLTFCLSTLCPTTLQFWQWKTAPTSFPIENGFYIFCNAKQFLHFVQWKTAHLKQHMPPVPPIPSIGSGKLVPVGTGHEGAPVPPIAPLGNHLHMVHEMSRLIKMFQK